MSSPPRIPVNALDVEKYVFLERDMILIFWLYLSHRRLEKQLITASPTRLHGTSLPLMQRRLRTMEVEASCGYVVGWLMANLPGQADSLAQLVVRCHDLDRVNAMGHIDANIVARPMVSAPWNSGFTAPNLHKVTTFAHPGLPVTLASYNNVRSLTINFPNELVFVDPSHLLCVLALFPDLTHLHIDGAGAPAYDLQLPLILAPHRSFSLRSLEQLTLRGIYRELLIHFITHARFPVLVRLELSHLPHFHALPRVFAYLDQSAVAPRLQTLCLRQLGPGVFLAVLPHLTFCRHLLLREASALDSTQMGMLNAPHGLTGTWFCPKLAVLEVAEAPLVTVETWRSVVRGRNELPANREHVKPLQVLTVFHESRLRAMDVAYFSAQVPVFNWTIPRREQESRLSATLVAQ
ncbi:hypothetical protein EIP91_008537 [Steccherinum ochraceum]|uniref:F-box domain-containing protein n=1 Tax=Steccherinum ochraceum TaxID=92696 RepID=A0A4R0R5F8_9APHY|nr:hypothetical protein EIP91_008537 [Steccherinum ochraceum]